MFRSHSQSKKNKSAPQRSVV